MQRAAAVRGELQVPVGPEALDGSGRAAARSVKYSFAVLAPCLTVAVAATVRRRTTRLGSLRANVNVAVPPAARTATLYDRRSYPASAVISPQSSALAP
jgi:hypothetical protein